MDLLACIAGVVAEVDANLHLRVAWAANRWQLRPVERGQPLAGLPAERALEWLRAIGESLRAPEKSKEKSDLMHAIYERITVAGPEIVGVRLTQAAYAHGLALALSQKVAMARPTGVGRALATYEIPIEGRDEWLAAARRLA